MKKLFIDLLVEIKCFLGVCILHGEEIHCLCKQLGLQCLYNVGVDHLSFLASEKVDSMSDTEYEKLLEYQLKASSHPEISGVSLHRLWIGKNKADSFSDGFKSDFQNIRKHRSIMHNFPNPVNNNSTAKT